MKGQVRVLGLDDGPFSFGDDTAPLIGVLTRTPNYVEGILSGRVSVDGTDATDVISRMVLKSRYREQIKLVMLDGGCMGGFNVVDIEELYRLINLPVATVSRDPPDHDAVREALRGHFKDWECRWEMMSRGKEYSVSTGRHVVYGRHVGLEADTLRELLVLSTVRGAVPEPLRIAHLVATALVRGESRGRA
jgi:endonuclease V-like protein UPF0215 family